MAKQRITRKVQAFGATIFTTKDGSPRAIANLKKRGLGVPAFPINIVGLRGKHIRQIPKK